MRKFTLLLALFLVLILNGCGTKRQYFEPESTTGKAKLTHNLPSKISYVTSSGATLKNGNIITKNGLNSQIKLKDGFVFLGEYDGNIISANTNGELNISDNNGNTIFNKNFSSAIVSASLENNLIAAVSASNHIYLLDLHNAQTLMQYKSSEIYAIDSRVAAPIFLSTIILYPSLDGRVYVTQKNGQILRDIVISSESFFNNVIFLDVIDEHLIAATAKKIIVVSPQKISQYSAEIKNIVRNNHNIYILKKDGLVTKTNLDLEELANTYFKFAIFSDALIYDNKLNIIEKTGYLIKTDLNLNSHEIIELSSEIQDKSFISKDSFYYDDEFMKFD